MSTTSPSILSRTFLPQTTRAPEPTSSAPSRWGERLPVLLVLAIALALAVVLYLRFLPQHDALWYATTHDRNAHYLYSLRLAADVRGGNVLRLAADLNSAQVWPPFQDAVAALLLIVGGFDDRLAVLPSLAGWVLALLFAFLVARRIVPKGGTLAGLVAVLFLASSPMHRAFAVDIMLESLGTGLTLIALFLYLRAVQDPVDTGRASRIFALVLTILFVHKYNYWLIVGLALAATEVLVHRQMLWEVCRRVLASVDFSALLRRQLCHPANYVLTLLVVLIAAVYQHGDRPLEWNGRSLGVYPPYNLMQFTYWILFLRLVVWWRRSGREWVDSLDPRLQAVVRWHLWPAACWMVLPRHVGPFLWYLSTAQGAPEVTPTLLEGLRFYGAWAISEYHLSLLCVVAASALLVVGLMSMGWLKRGGGAIAVFFLLSVFLTARHPNHQDRFLTTWIAAGWVLAGAGAAALVYGRLTRGFAVMRPILAVSILAGLGVMHAAGNWSAPVQLTGPHPEFASLREVTDDYLPDLAGSQRVTILAGLEIRPMHQWTFLERYGQLTRLDDRFDGFGEPGVANREGFRPWLQTTDCETIVLIDAVPTATGSVTWWHPSRKPEYALDYHPVLAEQTTFRLIRRREFPQHGCSVAVWKRIEPDRALR